MASINQSSQQLYRRYVRNLALMYQKRKDVRSFIEVLLSLSVITIFGIFAIKPTLVTISELNTQIRGQEDTIDKLDDKISSLITAQENFDRNLTAISLMKEAIPSSAEPDLYIRQIEGLAKRHSLYIVGMNTGGISVLGDKSQNAPGANQDDEETQVDLFPNNAYRFEFEMNLSGNYEQIDAFAKDFESLRRPMFADSFSLRQSRGNLPGDIVISVVGRIPFVPDE